jgi:hypothetical protein
LVISLLCHHIILPSIKFSWPVTNIIKQTLFHSSLDLPGCDTVQWCDSCRHFWGILRIFMSKLPMNFVMPSILFYALNCFLKMAYCINPLLHH